MALVTRSSDAGVDTSSAIVTPPIAGNLYAGEDLDPAAPCYIKASDGLVYMSNGTAGNEAARTHGFTPKSYKTGQPVTLYGPGVRLHYDTAGGLTQSQPLFAGATKGRLDSAATTGGTTALAFAVDTYDIIVVALQVG